MSHPIARYPDTRPATQPSAASRTRPGRLAWLLIALAGAAPGARADCELLYAPPGVRARLLAFHHATETRRAQEHRDRHAGVLRRGAPTRPDTAPARRSGRADAQSP